MTATSFVQEEFDRRRARIDCVPESIRLPDSFLANSSDIEALFERLEDVDALPQTDAEDVLSGERVSVPGRVHTIRGHGKIWFASIWVQLPDMSALVQVIAIQDSCEFFDALECVDLGDIIGVSGVPVITKKGEPSLLCTHWTLLAKSLRQWPEKWHGLQDRELQFRQRYLSLTLNPEIRSHFVMRSELISLIREYLDEHDFLEVETPIVQMRASGAAANPFSTHHDATDSNLFLRIAMETYLKQLIVGGMPRVYEIGKCFRNEGVDPTHLPEFTMLEYYGSYWNYIDNIGFTVRLLNTVFDHIHPERSFPYGDHVIEYNDEWSTKTYEQLFQEFLDVQLFTETDDGMELRTETFFQDLIAKHKLPGMSGGAATLMDYAYKKLIRPQLIQPVIVTHHPIEAKPLARRNAERPWTVDSFQALVVGQEIVNGYSELNDPIDQRARLVEQQRLRDEGDTEAMIIDESFLLALEYGMPPVSGTGIGIDRLCVIMHNQPTLRESIYFPLMKTHD